MLQNLFLYLCLNIFSVSHLQLFFFRQNLLCDVTLVADGVEIPAHKMVLASCSPYFYAMFTSFTESKAEKITIQGVDGQALQILVDYVYSSEIQVTEDNVQVILLFFINFYGKIHLQKY